MLRAFNEYNYAGGRCNNLQTCVIDLVFEYEKAFGTLTASDNMRLLIKAFNIVLFKERKQWHGQFLG